MSYDPMPAIYGYTPSASSYREKEKVRAERNEAKAAERRAQLAQRQAERAAQRGTTTTAAPQAGRSYHDMMHAVGRRFPAVADRWRQVGLAILDGATVGELSAQLGGTAGSSTTSTTRGTSATARQTGPLSATHGDGWMYLGYSQPPPGHEFFNPECWTDADQAIADAIREEEQH